MTKYLLEIQNRGLLILIAWFSTILVSYLYKEILLFVVAQPYILTNLKEHFNPSYFIFTDVTEILSVFINLTVFLSFQVFCIYTLYHFFLFLSPAFFYVEYSFWKLGVQIVTVMWTISAALSSCFLIPLTWHFFLSFQDLTFTYSFKLYFEAKIKEYFYFYTSTYFLYLFYFQLFSLLILFFSYSKISINKIKKYRKFNYFGFVILATGMSSPDILNQLCISITIIFIYELSLFIFLFKNHC